MYTVRKKIKNDNLHLLNILNKCNKFCIDKLNAFHKKIITHMFCDKKFSQFNNTELFISENIDNQGMYKNIPVFSFNNVISLMSHKYKHSFFVIANNKLTDGVINTVKKKYNHVSFINDNFHMDKKKKWLISKIDFFNEKLKADFCIVDCNSNNILKSKCLNNIKTFIINTDKINSKKLFETIIHNYNGRLITYGKKKYTTNLNSIHWEIHNESDLINNIATIIL